jgi:hypothetical protein
MGKVIADEFQHLRDGDAADALHWTAARSTLEANQYSMRALESLLLETGPAEHDTTDADVASQALEQAIAHHQRAIEDLEFALEALDERDRVTRDASE